MTLLADYEKRLKGEPGYTGAVMTIDLLLTWIRNLRAIDDGHSNDDS